MSSTESALNYGDEDTGFDVTDEVDVGDVSTQQGGDAIEPKRNVLFEIRKASVRPYIPRDGDGTWMRKFLALDLVVGPEGVDGEGKFANKHFFEDLLLVANIQDFPDLNTDYYKEKARFDIKTFFKAMGYDPAKPPKINDDFLIGITGQNVRADITREQVRTKTGIDEATGKAKYEATGEYKNRLKNYRAVEG